MKKISLLALIVLSFMACKNDTSKTETNPESSIKTQNTESENNKKEPISFVNAILLSFIYYSIFVFFYTQRFIY